jgi:hypothetical protein
MQGLALKMPDATDAALPLYRFYAHFLPSFMDLGMRLN